MILIADTHVSHDNSFAFFEMLKLFEQNNQDLIFLGDIFDLWLALPSYEQDIHIKFLEWCKRQKKKRIIGYIEGNHEFFLASKKHDYFSWCIDKPWYKDNQGNLFCHGDMINIKDTGYLLFKKLSKNIIIKIILQNLPFGPEIVKLIKKGLNKKNSKFQHDMPEKEILDFADKWFNKEVNNIFAGHFHQKYIYKNQSGKTFYILPDWLNTGKITFFNEELNKIIICNWQKILFFC